MTEISVGFTIVIPGSVDPGMHFGLEVKRLICSINQPNHCYWEWNVCLNIKICKYLCSNYTNMSNFQPLDVVGRGSETQLQVGENFKKFIQQNKGWIQCIIINYKCCSLPVRQWDCYASIFYASIFYGAKCRAIVVPVSLAEFQESVTKFGFYYYRIIIIKFHLSMSSYHPTACHTGWILDKTSITEKQNKIVII